ncbi:protease-4 [Phyllobacterium endophyticum]|uniref:Signal peptide peptidase SppA n=2 Tax=Phyllobacterium endophyticum TaxID=1149773 RepID=A0A2P7AZZ3_9HYPH|nr:signal peptide peptidase SppA [Phyllobacterium endophyticum]MBB3235581.1 protease-4 [Phyllobacterium endophyticum]PSH59788.1 signal peptide peptidase SppA [Phyllobacterium endophyticum]TYR41936.1 signal peptide peptidase SppA [Phyllobacterium endophyticum]
MANTADAIIDRRRLRRKLTFWRVLAFAILAVAMFGLYFFNTGSDGLSSKSAPHIAKVRVEGTIFENDELLKRLKDVEDSDAVKGVILSVDSPGGTTAGGEAIYEAVRKLAMKKPVVSQVGTLAASAGYMIASASDHIVARQSSIIGSIGVLFQYPDISQLLGKLGVKVETIKSSPLKAEPNFFNPASEEAKAMIHRMIIDSYDWFVGLVQERRKFTHEQALALADGSVFTGRQAVANKLIDELGGEEKALGWLKTKGVDDKLPVLEWKPVEKSSLGMFFSHSAVKMLAKYLGIPEESAGILRELTGDRMFLDGLVSVWHVDGKPVGAQ